jgi:hypothetical protein
MMRLRALASDKLTMTRARAMPSSIAVDAGSTATVRQSGKGDCRAYRKPHTLDMIEVQ